MVQKKTKNHHTCWIVAFSCLNHRAKTNKCFPDDSTLKMITTT